MLMTGYKQTSRAIERSIMPRIIFVFLLIRRNGRQVSQPASLTFTYLFLSSCPTVLRLLSSFSLSFKLHTPPFFYYNYGFGLLLCLRALCCAAKSANLCPAAFVNLLLMLLGTSPIDPDCTPATLLSTFDIASSSASPI